MIKCVCLVEETEDNILLVQVRNREKYYFPGGKIEPNETHSQALIRELKEEIQLDLSEDQLEYIGTVIGPAYPQPNTLTELNSYRSKTKIDWASIQTDHEITDIQWVSKNNEALIAPAVLEWIKQLSSY